MSIRLHGIQEAPEADLTPDGAEVLPFVIRAPELRSATGADLGALVQEGRVLTAYSGRFGGQPTLTARLQSNDGTGWRDEPYIAGNVIDTADFTGLRIRYGIDATNLVGAVAVYSTPVTVTALPDLATGDSTEITIDTTRRTADEQEELTT